MKFSYRSAKWSVLGSILHMVGQMEDLRQIVKVSDVALWCGVTKQTARRYVNELTQERYLIEHSNPYRGNIHIYTYTLTPHARRDYNKKEYKPYYRQMMESKEIFI